MRRIRRKWYKGKVIGYESREGGGRQYYVVMKDGGVLRLKRFGDDVETWRDFLRKG